jgi:hypothetical protein
MEKIIDFSWILDSGKTYPAKNWPPEGWSEMTPAELTDWRSNLGEMVGYQWFYQGKLQKVLWDQIPYKVFDLLADETGFLVLPEIYWSAEAKILNGDLGVRCTMYPRFNVRGFSDTRLEEVKRANIIRYGDWTPTPHFKQQSRADTKRTDGIIEIEGNDGIADCLFFYDVQTGEFVGAKPFTWSD